MTKRVARADWRAAEGVVVLFGENDSEGIAVPLTALPNMAMQARRFMAGSQVNPEVGGWKFVSPVTVQTAQVHTMPTPTGDCIVLILDPGTEAEFQLSFLTNDIAREVGEALVQEAKAASSIPEKRN